jgi:hypothetical protein
MAFIFPDDLFLKPTATGKPKQMVSHGRLLVIKGRLMKKTLLKPVKNKAHSKSAHEAPETRRQVLRHLTNYVQTPSCIAASDSGSGLVSAWKYLKMPFAEARHAKEMTPSLVEICWNRVQVKRLLRLLATLWEKQLVTKNCEDSRRWGLDGEDFMRHLPFSLADGKSRPWWKNFVPPERSIMQRALTPHRSVVVCNLCQRSEVW